MINRELCNKISKIQLIYVFYFLLKKFIFRYICYNLKSFFTYILRINNYIRLITNLCIKNTIIFLLKKNIEIHLSKLGNKGDEQLE